MLSSTCVADPVFLLPPLRETIAAAGLDARKSLGQHFLLDLNLTGRIARYVDGREQGTILEVGPGPGGLTRALLLEGAGKVVAIERDDRAVALLASLVEAAGGRLQVVGADALEFDYASVPAPRRVVSNLPYNVGTPLLIGWLENIHLFESLTLMFQKEVALRIVAQPRTPEYGRLSVMAQWRCRAKKLFDLPAQAFTPPPKVDSSVVQLVPRTEPAPVAWKDMEKVVAAAFSHRRKMLRSALKSLGDAEGILANAGIDGTRRAEELGVDDFVRLTQAWCAARPAAQQ